MMVEIALDARIGVYGHVALTNFIAGLLDGPVDVVRRGGLKPHLRPSGLADAIDAF